MTAWDKSVTSWYLDFAQQKQWYEFHTKIGMISLFTLSIPKKVYFSYQLLEYENHTRNGMTFTLLRVWNFGMITKLYSGMIFILVYGLIIIPEMVWSSCCIYIYILWHIFGLYITTCNNAWNMQYTNYQKVNIYEGIRSQFASHQNPHSYRQIPGCNYEVQITRWKQLTANIMVVYMYYDAPAHSSCNTLSLQFVVELLYRIRRQPSWWQLGKGMWGLWESWSSTEPMWT